MLVPVGAADLVLDEAISGFRIRNPQQRLGQAHQHHAFLGRERILVQEGIEPAPLALRANALHEVTGERFGFSAFASAETCHRKQGLDGLGFVRKIEPRHLLARIVHGHGTGHSNVKPRHARCVGATLSRLKMMMGSPL